MRQILPVLLALACGGTDPAVDPIPGRWLLETVNGQALPAGGQVIAQGFPVNDAVASGRLVIHPTGSGFPRWEYCTRDAADGHLTLRGEDDVRYLEARGGQPAELLFIFPLGASRDTLRLQGDVLVWEYNLRSDPGSSTDLLRFRRLTDGEADGPVCALAS